MKSTHEAVSCNILRVEVETNCPRGGDTGHGGRTQVSFIDEGGTAMDESHIHGDGTICLVFTGDTECETLIECLRFAANELERQWNANAPDTPYRTPSSMLKEWSRAEYLAEDREIERCVSGDDSEGPFKRETFKTVARFDIHDLGDDE